MLDRGRSPKPIRCLWLGPCQDHFGWLLEQVQKLAQVRRSAPLLPVFEPTENAVSNIDRIILAVDSRVDLNSATLAKLRDFAGPTPVALALGSYWEGHRRTGWDPPETPQFYWYQFVDRISPWLVAGTEFADRTLADHPSVFQASATRVDHHLAACTVPGDFLTGFQNVVIAAHPATADAIASTIRDAGGKVVTGGPDLLDSDLTPDFVWWDHSSAGTCLDTFDSQANRQIDLAMRRWPTADLVVLASSPRWDQWRIWRSAGAKWLLAKPFRSDGIARVALMSGRMPFSGCEFE